MRPQASLRRNETSRRKIQSRFSVFTTSSQNKNPAPSVNPGTKHLWQTRCDISNGELTHKNLMDHNQRWSLRNKHLPSSTYDASETPIWHHPPMTLTNYKSLTMSYPADPENTWQQPKNWLRNTIWQFHTMMKFQNQTWFHQTTTCDFKNLALPSKHRSRRFEPLQAHHLTQSLTSEHSDNGKTSASGTNLTDPNHQGVWWRANRMLPQQQPADRIQQEHNDDASATRKLTASNTTWRKNLQHCEV